MKRISVGSIGKRLRSSSVDDAEGQVKEKKVARGKMEQKLKQLEKEQQQTPP
jgi:hypothetical protein